MGNTWGGKRRGHTAKNTGGEKLLGLAGACGLRNSPARVRRCRQAGGLKLADCGRRGTGGGKCRNWKTKGRETGLPELNDETLQTLCEKLAWRYGFGSAMERAAKSSVTALRRQAEELDDEAGQVFSFQLSGRRRVRNRKLNAADAGTAHHKFLQHVALENVSGLAALEAEASRLEQEKALSADERGILDLKAVAGFWSSKTGKEIQKQAANVRRELAFTAKFSPAELSEIIGAKSAAGLENEFIVVQGVADLAVLLPKEIWLVDFKTDEVRAGDLPQKMKLYAPQLKLYARALAKIYSRPGHQLLAAFSFSSQNRAGGNLTRQSKAAIRRPISWRRFCPFHPSARRPGRNSFPWNV